MVDESVIRRIASWRPGTVATSLYLDVDGLRHPRWPDVEQRAEHLFRSARQRAELAPPGTPGEVEKDLAAMRAWLGRGIDRSATRGIGLFSCASQDLFEAVELTTPVRDQVAVDPEPDIAQLCAAAAASWSAIAVAVDKERSRVARLDPEQGARELDLLDDTMPHAVDVDIELAGFERHEEELAREHFRRVARVVSAEMVRAPARYVVLLGSEESVKELEAYLPRHVADLVVGRRPMPGYAPTSQLAAAARDVVEGAQQEQRSAILAALRERAATGTSVATGLDATLAALGDREVGTLVVERTFEAPGGRCEVCRLLVTGPGPCPRCGGSVRGIGNVVDAAVADVFLDHGALEPVEDGSLSDFGRIGALLRRWARPTTGGAGDA